MAKGALGSIYVLLGTEEIGSYVESAKLSLGRSAVDIGSLGEAYETFADGNNKRWAVTLGIYQEYNSSEKPIYGLIKSMYTGTTGKAFEIRPSTAAATRFNPSFAGNVVLDGDFDFFNAVRNEANKFSVTLKGNGAPTFVDTSS